jgi:PAS domain S-box-containing protein
MVEGRGVSTSIGGSPAVLVAINDITERYQAGLALKESEERLRQITETLTSVFYVHDRSSNKFIYVSPAYEKIWKRTCQSLYDDPYTFLEAVHPDDLARLQESIRQELEDGNYVDTEYRIIRTDGSVCWIHSHNYPVTDTDGKVYRVAGIAEDITSQRNTEGALRESEDRYRTLAEASRDIIFLMMAWNMSTAMLQQSWDFQPIRSSGKTAPPCSPVNWENVRHRDCAGYLKREKRGTPKGKWRFSGSCTGSITI